MLLNQDDFFKEMQQERLAVNDYEQGCARVYGFDYEVPKLGIRLTCNICAFSQEMAARLLYRQLPIEWRQKGVNITTFEAKARVDLISPECFENYKNRLVPAGKK